jgi:CheY-like chemotaxis protein
VRLEADATRLAQVVANLLNNAAKYTEERGHIGLTVERDGGEAVVRVRDTGVGIPAEMLAQVFDLFTQVTHSLERSQGGLGIGLTLARSLVEMHGGSVRAHSDGPGQGSEFVVRLPVLTELRSESPGPGLNGQLIKPSARRILVVDDNVDAADSLAVLLRLVGNDVRTAHDGPAALEAARAYRPDVVLLDLGLPRMSGYEVCRRLREGHFANGPLVVALTGYGQDEDRRRTREAGFDRHLVKPVNPDELWEVLTEDHGRGNRLAIAERVAG